jgi:hypothetical protein
MYGGRERQRERERERGRENELDSQSLLITESYCKIYIKVD